ncbi:MAG TPA: VWA domain-containing protein [Elusimicrobiota bacterium]|nr:VWA domain-containing protein [Elusimicrobiota bacterium]
MSFAHPSVLWLLCVLPLMALYERRFGPHARARFRFSSFRLLGEGRVSGQRPGSFVLTLLRLSAVGLLIIVLARPQRGQSWEEVMTPATDIMLCVDTSTSMEALDFKPKNRLDASRDVIRDFIKNRRRDRIGLVVFSALAFTQCPLTLDHGALLGFLDQVKIGMVREDGTAIGNALAACVSRLKDSEAKSKTIILLTDGRNNRGTVDPLTAAKTAAAFGIRIYTIGAGVPGGAVYPVRDPFFGTRYVKLPEEIDEGMLREIAELAGARYFRATSLESLKEIYREIDRLEKTDVKSKTFTDYRDSALPFLMLAFALFMMEGVLSYTVYRSLP